MAAFASLLRGINVGGNALIRMGPLVELYGELGLHDAKSLLQSGNVVFTAAGKPAALAAKLKRAIAERFGVSPEVFIRTRDELAAAMENNPFEQEAKDDPGRLVVIFFEKAPGAKAGEAVAAAIKGREKSKLHGRELYVYYPDGQGRSKLTNAVIERAAGAACTARNWNTVGKLVETLSALESR